MIYVVKRIDEDLDFGCEERTADAPVMAVVTLVPCDGYDGTDAQSSGNELRVKQEDAMLYERDINEGDRVYFDKDKKLTKMGH